jgi:SPP1 gp7 family putative phage head morphogenesis protein
MPRAEILATLRILRSLGPLPRARTRLPRQLPPDTIADAYASELVAFLGNARALVRAEVLPRLPAIVAERGARRDADDPNDLLDRLSARFFGSIPRGSLESLAQRYGNRTSEYQKQQLGRQIKAALGVDVFREPSLRGRLGAFVTENVALIKSVPNKYLDDVEKVITRGLREGLRWEQIAADVAERGRVAESSARLIARDQVGKFYGEVQGARQRALGVTHFIWRTVSDNRVRPEHEELDGERFAWADPPSEGIPGHAINCRCYGEPDFSSVLEGL